MVNRRFVRMASGPLNAGLCNAAATCFLKKSALCARADNCVLIARQPQVRNAEMSGDEGPLRPPVWHR